MTPRRLLFVLLRHFRLKETWVIFFTLGVIMMNYPFISIFNKPRLVLGFPLLYLYLMLGWLVSICVIFLFTRAIGTGNGDEGSGDPR